MQWLTVIAAVVAIIFYLRQLGYSFDKDDDPNTRALKDKIGRWLAGQGTGDLPDRQT